jgi:hypothetical protein
VQTVEVRFRGEKLSTVTSEDRAYTLYHTPRRDYYFVHYDRGEAGAYLVTGKNAAVPNGHLREGVREKHTRSIWSELLSAAGLD